MTDKTLKEITEKLDEFLDWLVDSPMNNKDFNTIHRIFDKYLDEEKNDES